MRFAHLFEKPYPAMSTSFVGSSRDRPIHRNRNYDCDKQTRQTHTHHHVRQALYKTLWHTKYQLSIALHLSSCVILSRPEQRDFGAPMPPSPGANRGRKRLRIMRRQPAMARMSVATASASLAYKQNKYRKTQSKRANLTDLHTKQFVLHLRSALRTRRE